MKIFLMRIGISSYFRYKKLLKQKQDDEDSLKAIINELEATVATKESNIEVLRNDLRRLAANNSEDKSCCGEVGSELAEKESALLKVRICMNMS